MNILQLLVAIEHDGMPRRLARAIKKLKPKLLPILRTMQQDGVVVPVEVQE